MFRVGAAIWDLGPGIFFMARDLPSFEERGYGIVGGRGFDARVLEDRIVFTPAVDDAGAHITLSSDVNAWRWDYRLNCCAPYLCRCHVFDTAADWDGDTLIIPLPPPHELPYPLPHYHGDEERRLTENHALVVRDILARIESARERTGSPRISVAPHFQARLTPQERVELFSQWTITPKTKVAA